MRNRQKAVLALTAALLLAGWGCQKAQNAGVTTDLSAGKEQPAYNEQASAGLSVSNQSLVNSTLNIPKVTLANDGWVVIHADKSGVPGEIIGQAAVTAGEHTDVKVTVTESKVTPIVHAILHIDTGAKGMFEFPGVDVPVTANGVAVSGSFKVLSAADTSKTAGVKTDANLKVIVETKKK